MSDYLMEVVDKELINHGIKPTDLNYVSYACVERHYMAHEAIPLALIVFGPAWFNDLARGVEHEIMAQRLN